MTTEDEARLAEIRERCKSPPWQEHDIGFLLRVIDTAHARIAQIDADYVQAAHDRIDPERPIRGGRAG